VLTLLEVFRVRWNVDLAAFIRETGYSRSHVLRVRSGKVEPSRDLIGAAVSAMRRLTLRDVRAEDLFELTSETSGPWERRRERPLAPAARAWKKERTANEALFAQLRKTPPETWPSVIGIPSETLVRAFLYEARTVFDRLPAYAERLSALAAGMVDALDDVRPAYRQALRANAALERANALRQIGRLRDALAMLDVADAACEGEPECTHILARAWLCRGSVLFKTGDLDQAELWLRRAINLFAAVDDQLRVAKVRAVQGGVLFERGAFERARAIWTASIPPLTAGYDRHTLAIVWLNLAWCETELGEVATAMTWANVAREAFKQLHVDSEELRSRWCEARLIALHGDRNAGLRTLVDVRNAMEKRSSCLMREWWHWTSSRRCCCHRHGRNLHWMWLAALCRSSHERAPHAKRVKLWRISWTLLRGDNSLPRRHVQYVRAYLKRSEREPICGVRTA
jgi:tetratricopeptide (TPR) repeat protein